MTYRINGTGTTISPMPKSGELSIAMKWFTLFFIPLLPLGWVLVQAGEREGDIINYLSTKYTILKKLTYSEVKDSLGLKGMMLTISYSYCTGAGALGLFIGLFFIIASIKYLFFLLLR
ncbi:hypothetical protein ACF0MN_10850 [Legionella pneumophila]|uniref:hypothetical protein n=1 Tax=Legionella pneumophila TaxID=446 RepID=UPI002AFB3675|nr:hypothetical protein [Legionella pneumophila]